MEIWPLVFPAVMTSCCNLLTFLKSTHNLLFGGSPEADFLGTTTIGLAHLDILLVIMHNPGSHNCAIFVRYINSSELHLQSVALRSQYSDPAPEVVMLH